MQHWKTDTEGPTLKQVFPVSYPLVNDRHPIALQNQPTLPGYGIIDVDSRDGCTFLKRLRGGSPLKLLTPRPLPRAARVIAGSHGGGLLAGDEIHLDIRVGQSAALYLGTQASTKIYRSESGRASRQSIQLQMLPGSSGVMLPDPVTPFRQAVYEQRFSADLSGDATLVWLDWFTCGREACGERWGFSRYATRSDILVDGQAIFRDALRLDATDGPLDDAARTNGYNCFGSLLLLGPRANAIATNLLREIGQNFVERNQRLVFSASPLAVGCIVRFAGATTEMVGRWLRDRLTFVAGMLGEDPWARKY